VSVGPDARAVADGQLALLGEGGVLAASVPDSATEGGRFLLLAGVPIREPVVRYGPFVLNSYEEVREAVEEMWGA